MLQQIYKDFLDNLIECEKQARKRANGRPLTALTEEEKFAIAFLSGVQFESSKLENGKLTFTLKPCNVVFTGKSWAVYTNAPNKT